MDQAFLTGRRAHLVNKLSKVRRSLLQPGLPHAQREWKLRAEIPAIAAAFRRLELGTYGLCIECEKPIPLTRLEILPDATLCIGCQREVEQSRQATNT